MKLWEPLEHRSLAVQNRVAVTSYAAYHHLFAPGADIGWYVEHLARRSEVGLFVLQCAFPRLVGIDPPAVPLDHLTDILGTFVEALHRGGARAILQLSHQGTHANGAANPTVRAIQGFTAVDGEVSPEVAHEMSSGEIEALVEGFGELAAVAAAAGLDGVEVHGGHGHLVHQSIGRWGNRRDDEWGAPLAFTTAIARRIRDVAPHGVVGMRFPSDDHRPPSDGGSTEDQVLAWAAELGATGLLDYLNPTEGSSYDHYHRSIGTFRRPRGEFMDRTRAIRAAVAGTVPIMGVGRITTVEDAEAVLADGSCDLVAMTRAHLADPEILSKSRSGRAAEVRRCVGVNQGCLDRAHSGAPLTCFQNPDVGRESPIILPPVRRRRVLVVGAGPAGLKAAESAARVGHDVTLVDASSRIGGRLAAITPSSEAAELVEAVAWIHAEAVRLGVDVRLGTTADADLIRDARPDVVIVATGSRPAPPPFETDGSVPVLATDEAIDASTAAPLGRVLVLDDAGTEEVRVTWEQLAALGNQVVICTPHASIGRYLGHTHAVDIVHDTLRRGCTIEERTQLMTIRDGAVTTTDRLTNRDRARTFDAVVLASQRRAHDSLARLVGAGIDVRTIGDAYAPRNAMTAIREGDDTGRTL